MSKVNPRRRPATEADVRRAWEDGVICGVGNACNHEKTLRFIDSGYDLSILPIRRDDT